MEIIATRLLQYSMRGEHQRNDLKVCIYSPFVVLKASVDFEVSEGVAGCRWELEGLPEKLEDVAYGSDSVQALQLASNIDPVIRSLRAKYDFWFPTGEPYFED